MIDSLSKEALEDLVKHKGRLHSCREGIAGYLDRVIREHKGFPARSFYGESFSYWLFSLSGERYRESLDNLVLAYVSKDKEAPNFHWEFNKYAWISVLNIVGNSESEIKDLVFPLRFKGTPATNWMLLRCCTQILANADDTQALQDARKILSDYQSPSGLIKDEVGVRSLQYHCFSSILAAEISMQCNDAVLRDRFIKSANFIENIVLRTGDALYVGRGQQQSFGYGAIIYLLALAGYLTKGLRYIRKMELCIAFLTDFQRQDGSFPLVLNGVEDGFPASAALADPLYSGWYAYNNYFDYLPFLGVMLAKAENVLSAMIDKHKEIFVDSPTNTHENESRYQDADFLVVHRSGYEAVLARTGGHWKGGGLWTNDLPMPYVVCRGKRITPSYGGEQYGRTLFGTRGIPLPLAQVGKELSSLRDGRIWSFWHGDTLIVITPKAILFRKYVFREKQVVVKDRILSPYKMYHYYLFENVHEIIQGREFTINHGAKVISDEYLRIEDCPQYFWGGKLTALRSLEPGMTNSLTISLEAVK